MFAQRFTDRISARGEKGVGHAAADDEDVHVGEQVAEQVELGRYLGSADDRRERTHRRVQHVCERFELMLHAAAGIARQSAGDALDRRMSAVRRGKGVVDEEVAELRQLRDKNRIVALLAGMEAGVFQAQDVARFHGVDRRRGAFADAILHERHRALENVGERRHDELERLGRIGPLRTPEMGEQDHLAALVRDLPDGRSDALDASRVGDLAVLGRHVEIDAHEHALAPDVGLIERAEHVSSPRVRWCEPNPPRRNDR